MSHITINKTKKMPSTVHSVNRKTSKPMMEKRRRARINQSLSELKDLIMCSTQSETDNCRRSKLEKADILEMAVRHLHWLHQREKGPHDNEPRTVAITEGRSSSEKFSAGFHRCIDEVNSYLDQKDLQVDGYIRNRLTKHLTNCLQLLHQNITQVNKLNSHHVNSASALPQCSTCRNEHPMVDHARLISRSPQSGITTNAVMAVQEDSSKVCALKSSMQTGQCSHVESTHRLPHKDVKDNRDVKTHFQPKLPTLGENGPHEIHVWRPW